MAIRCKCYENGRNWLGKIGSCLGTKEREPCSCGGDPSKCDFYDYIREGARKPKTHYEEILSMSLEELAEYLFSQYENGVFTAQGKLFDRKERDYYIRKKIEWLKEETV